MHLSTPLLLLAACATSAVALEHSPKHRMQKRQIDLIPAPAAPPVASAPASRISAVPSASSAATVPSAASSLASLPVSSPATTAPPSSAIERTTAQPVTVTATPTTASVERSTAPLSSAPRFTTSTALVTPTLSSALNSMPTLNLNPTPTAESNNSGSGSGSLSKPTLIGIIVAASVVAAIAAIWTIIRKTKFSPSKRFESKLEPIDFIPSGRIGENHATRTEGYGSGHGGSQEKLSAGMAGYGSGRQTSYDDSLERSDSEKSRNDTSYGYTQPSGNQGYQQDYHQQHQGYPSEPAQYGSYADLQRGPSAPVSNHRGYAMNQNNGGGYYQPQQSRY